MNLHAHLFQLNRLGLAGALALAACGAPGESGTAPGGQPGLGGTGGVVTEATGGLTGGGAVPSAGGGAGMTTAGGTGGLPSVGGTGGVGHTDPIGVVTVEGSRLFVDGEPFAIQGVAWNPVPKGAAYNGVDFAGAVDVDAPLMAAAGINAVRTYSPITDIAVLDKLFEHGIHVINGIYQYGGAPVRTAVDVVEATKDHPAILMWTIGNEWNYNGFYAEMSFGDALARVNEVTAAVKAVDTAHPVATVFGDPSGLSKATVDAMPLIDVWGINVYRGDSFNGAFDDYWAVSNKPLFLGEYGGDAINNGVIDVQSQAHAARALTLELQANFEAGVIGGTIFEWNDEWHKVEDGGLDTQEIGGLGPHGVYPDGYFNEEWWGIVDIDRNPRPAYLALKELYVGL